jgi:catechol 2,3-dioxygenase-like lactoylglutathione lyase family enzyme
MSVPSLESAIAFYRDAFGFELVDHEHLGQSEEGDRVTQMKNTDTTLAMLHAGNIFIELFEFHSPQPGENTRRMCDYGVTHFSFEVEDVYTSHEALKAHGVQWHSDPIDAG